MQEKQASLTETKAEKRRERENGWSVFMILDGGIHTHAHNKTHTHGKIISLLRSDNT